MFYPQVDTPYHDIDGFIEAERKHFDAFPDFKMPIKAMVAEGKVIEKRAHVDKYGIYTQLGINLVP